MTRHLTPSPQVWESDNPTLIKMAAPFITSGAWSTQSWDLFRVYSQAVDNNSVDYHLFKTVLAVHDGEYDVAQRQIDVTRRQVDTEVAALLGESYSRAYDVMVRMQQLTELEEVKFRVYFDRIS